MHALLVVPCSTFLRQWTEHYIRNGILYFDSVYKPAWTLVNPMYLLC